MKKTNILVMIILGICCAALNIYAQDITESEETAAVEKNNQSLLEDATADKTSQGLTGSSDTRDAQENIKTTEDNDHFPFGNRREQSLSRDITGIIANISIFGLPVLIVGLVLFFRYRDNQNLYKIVNNMVDKGMEIPTHLLQIQRKKAPRSDLHKGLILISLGLGIACFLKIQGGDAWSLGIIPLFIGVAYLIIWKLESGKQKEKTIEE